LLQKYVDQIIDVVSKTGEVTHGTLLTSGKSDQIVLRQSDGSLRSILLANAAEIRYPTLPEGLITKPTLHWLVNSDGAGERETEVAYLTSGLSWRADYVLLLNNAGTKADLDAWVTLDNSSGASYKNAKLKLIAGEVHRAQPPRNFGARNLAVDMMATAATKQFQEQAFFEYHLYTLQRPTDVLDNQTTQVSLFPSTTVGTKKIYTYDWRVNDKKVGVSSQFENTEANGLGMALPGGRVRVYQKGPDGSQEFIGEDNIDHTPKNEKVTVRVGDAFDIAAERTQKDFRRITDQVSETDYEVKLRNHKKETVEIVVVDHMPHVKINANKIEYHVTVEPEQEAVLTYTVRTS
jgi:hypothetical protein